MRVVQVGGRQSDQAALEAVLRSSGTGTLSVMVPPEALAEILADRVDVLLIDVMQTSQDVISLMRTAATTSVRYPVPVVVTAPNAAADRVEACLQRGASDYLLTPLSATQPEMILRRLKGLSANRVSRPLEATVTLSMPTLPTPALARAAAAPKAGKAAGGSKGSAENSQRFVPREFLDLLERESLGDVKLGDHVEREMTVFFSDIRDFTHAVGVDDPAGKLQLPHLVPAQRHADHPRPRRVRRQVSR